MPDILDLQGSAKSLTGLLPDLVCNCRISGQRSLWVRLTGTLDRRTSLLLQHTLRRAEHRQRLVVLDLRELSVIDLAGVQVIVDASIEAWLADRRLLVVRGRAKIDRVFARANVSDVVEIGDLQPLEPVLALQARSDPVRRQPPV